MVEEDIACRLGSLENQMTFHLTSDCGAHVRPPGRHDCRCLTPWLLCHVLSGRQRELGRRLSVGLLTSGQRV